MENNIDEMVYKMTKISGKMTKQGKIKQQFGTKPRKIA